MFLQIYFANYFEIDEIDEKLTLILNYFVRFEYL